MDSTLQAIAKLDMDKSIPRQVCVIFCSTSVFSYIFQLCRCSNDALRHCGTHYLPITSTQNESQFTPPGRDSATQTIAHLPDEILVYIFRFLGSIARFFHPEDWDNGLSGAFTFSQVCQRWRSLSLSTPSLWAAPFFENQSTVTLELVEMMLQRVGSHQPLYIRATLDTSHQIFERVSKLLQTHLADIIQIDLNSTASPSIISDALSLACGSASLLEVLELTVGENTGGSRTKPHLAIFLGETPTLHRLRLVNLWIDPQSPLLNTLTTLDLSLPALDPSVVVTVEDIYTILNKASAHIRSFRLECPYELQDCSVLALPSGRLHLPKIEWFEMTDSTPEPFSRLLRHLFLPKMSTLILEGVHAVEWTQGIYDLMLSVVAVWDRPLYCLKIRADWLISIEARMDCVQHNSFVMSIFNKDDIKYDKISPYAGHILTFTSRSFGMKNLEELELHGWSFAKECLHSVLSSALQLRKLTVHAYNTQDVIELLYSYARECYDHLKELTHLSLHNLNICDQPIEADGPPTSLLDQIFFYTRFRYAQGRPLSSLTLETMHDGDNMANSEVCARVKNQMEAYVIDFVAL